MFDFFAETGQHAHSAVARNRSRKTARLFARNVQPGPFPISQQVRVVAELLEAQFLAERGEVEVVGVRQRISEVHAHAGQPQFRLGLDYLGAQPRQRYRNLDRGARLKAAAGGDLLIHHRQNAPRGRIHRHYRSIVRAQCLHRRAADGQIFAIHAVAFRGIGISRFSPRAAGNYRG